MLRCQGFRRVSGLGFCHHGFQGPAAVGHMCMLVWYVQACCQKQTAVATGHQAPHCKSPSCWACCWEECVCAWQLLGHAVCLCSVQTALVASVVQAVSQAWGGISFGVAFSATAAVLPTPCCSALGCIITLRDQAVCSCECVDIIVSRQACEEGASLSVQCTSCCTADAV